MAGLGVILSIASMIVSILVPAVMCAFSRFLSPCVAYIPGLVALAGVALTGAGTLREPGSVASSQVMGGLICSGIVVLVWAAVFTLVGWPGC